MLKAEFADFISIEQVNLHELKNKGKVYTLEFTNACKSKQKRRVKQQRRNINRHSYSSQEQKKLQKFSTFNQY